MEEENAFQLDPEQLKDPEICRETGKRLYFDKEMPVEARNYGLSLLNRAVALKDNEARYLIGFLLVSGTLKRKSGDSVEHGLLLICSAADQGFLPARTWLNRYTNERYQKDMQSRHPEDVYQGPLIDFDGKVIKINRTGILTPIDATLAYADGENVLTLSANVAFTDGESDMADPQKFYNAVLRGMKDWQGEYRVFGNQKVRVEVVLTTEDRAFDNLTVIPMTKEMQKIMGDIFNTLGTKKMKERANNILEHKRSLAGVGLRKWSVYSRKTICILSQSERFDDYDEIRHTAKHEFGHALGLGDLYYNAADQLPGVEKGAYRELDSYYVSDKIYNLVMCDHHGPISNNDIEMVILAFSENRMQHYQPGKIKGKISDALGRGN